MIGLHLQKILGFVMSNDTKHHHHIIMQWCEITSVKTEPDQQRAQVLELDNPNCKSDSLSH